MKVYVPIVIVARALSFDWHVGIAGRELSGLDWTQAHLTDST